MTKTKKAKTVTVLESVGAPGATVKFIDQVVSDAPSDLNFVYFSWRNALFKYYDVIHFHWPEALLRSRHLPLRVVKYSLFYCLILRLKLTKRKIIRTVHNETPHTKGTKAEKFLLDLLDRSTSVSVVLNSVTIPVGSSQVVKIPHADYQEQLKDFPQSEKISGRITFFGRIDEYKNVPELVDIFTEWAPDSASLHIVGKPTEAVTGELMNSLLKAPETVSYDLNFVDDETMVQEITKSELVVLPYSELHNSGVLLVALSLKRPVLVPETPTTKDLKDEVGSDWILTFPQEGLKARHLQSSLASAKKLTGSPRLLNRSWSEIVNLYAEVFRSNA